jgi:hypothetical protein
MAGYADQSLHGGCLPPGELPEDGPPAPGPYTGGLPSGAWPFARAGIALRGAVRVLRTNFRHTRSIRQLAEAFRPPGRGGEGAQTFREGPPPELYRSADPGELRQLLCRKAAVLIGELGYEPENLCVLVSRREEVPVLVGLLEESGIGALDIDSSAFAFRERDRVRVATLHSCKGLDFPVVLLYLPGLERPGSFDPDRAERLLRNLVYVGMTRAMDHLSVFTADSEDPVLRDLAAAFEAL